MFYYKDRHIFYYKCKAHAALQHKNTDMLYSITKTRNILRIKDIFYQDKGYAISCTNKQASNFE